MDCSWGYMRSISYTQTSRFSCANFSCPIQLHSRALLYCIPAAMQQEFGNKGNCTVICYLKLCIPEEKCDSVATGLPTGTELFLLNIDNWDFQLFMTSPFSAFGCRQLSTIMFVTPNQILSMSEPVSKILKAECVCNSLDVVSNSAFTTSKKKWWCTVASFLPVATGLSLKGSTLADVNDRCSSSGPGSKMT